MSEINKSGRCSVCGTINSRNSYFCSACGAAFDNIAIKASESESAGEELRAEGNREGILDRLFDNRLGEGSSGKRRVITLRSIFTDRLIASIVMLVLSIGLLLAALYAPLAHSEVVYGEGVECSISYNGIDSLMMVYYSSQSLSDNRLMKSQLYKDTVAELNRLSLSTSGSRLTESKRLQLADASENLLCVYLMSSSIEMRHEVVFAALSFCMILIASILSLFGALVSLKRALGERFGKGRKEKLGAVKAPRAIWFIGAFMPLLGYSFSRMSYWGKGGLLSTFSSGGSGLSSGFVLLLAISAITIAYAASGVVLSGQIKSDGSAVSMKKQMITLVLAVIMLLSLFLPWISINFASVAEKQVKTEKTYISVAEIGDISEEGEDVYYGISSSMNAEILDTVIDEIVDSPERDDELAMEAVGLLNFGVDRYDISLIYTAINGVSYALFLICGMLVFRLVSGILYKKSNYGKIKGFKLLSALLSLVLAVLTFAFIIITGIAVKHYEYSYVMALKPSFGVIVCAVCAIGLLISLKKKENRKQIEEGYDNADVTYAPYVIKI